MPFLIAVGAGIVLTPFAGRVGRALGLVDRPTDDGLKIHRSAVPLTGGWAVVVVGLGASLIWVAVPPMLVLAVALALVVGTIDDIVSLSPWARVAGLALAGAALAVGGIGVAPLGPLGGAAIVVAVVASANAVNLIDGQDALAGGLATAAALGLGAIALGGTAAAVAFATAGALAAFVVWNRPPARIFLGNGGAYAAGTLLAALAGVVSSRGWPSLLGAVLCLAPFVFELTATVVRRFLARRPITGGDRAHGYDLVSDRLGRVPATIVLWAVGVLCAASGVLAARSSLSVAVAVAVAVALTGAATGTWLWRTPRIGTADTIDPQPPRHPADPQFRRTQREGST